MLRDIRLAPEAGLLEADHPRQRLLTAGARSLGHTELIALLLEMAGDGNSQAETLELTRKLLDTVRNLRTLAGCTPAELASIPGVTVEQAVLLTAALELGRRVARETVAKLRLDNPEIVARLMMNEYRGVKHESLRVLLLDTRSQLIHIEEISLGGLDISVAHPREIFRPALIHSAYAVIVVHNHPSGDPTPSHCDEMLTRLLMKASRTLMIELHDHLIIGSANIGEPAYYSFREHRKILGRK